MHLLNFNVQNNEQNYFAEQSVVKSLILFQMLDNSLIIIVIIC